MRACSIITAIGDDHDLGHCRAVGEVASAGAVLTHIRAPGDLDPMLAVRRVVARWVGGREGEIVR